MAVESNRNDFDAFGIILGERHKVLRPQQRLRGDYSSLLCLSGFEAKNESPCPIVVNTLSQGNLLKG